MKKSKTILIVEDEWPLMRAIGEKLTRNGFDTLQARTVDQALEYLFDDDISLPDLTWLDHYLPGKTEIDLVTAMKQDSSWGRIPIFLISNTAGPGKVSSYMQLGVNEYFVKSQNRLDNLVNEVKRFLKK